MHTLVHITPQCTTWSHTIHTAAILYVHINYVKELSTNILELPNLIYSGEIDFMHL